MYMQVVFLFFDLYIAFTFHGALFYEDHKKATSIYAITGAKLQPFFLELFLVHVYQRGWW